MRRKLEVRYRIGKKVEGVDGRIKRSEIIK
jgi:hypothetical protein